MAPVLRFNNTEGPWTLRIRHISSTVSVLIRAQHEAATVKAFNRGRSCKVRYSSLLSLAHKGGADQGNSRQRCYTNQAPTAPINVHCDRTHIDRKHIESTLGKSQRSAAFLSTSGVAFPYQPKISEVPVDQQQ